MFDDLALFSDPEPRDGPEQMALDEVLLETVERPVLRVYRWREPWVSFGYSQSHEAVRRERPGSRLVRRWTGGGIVDHERDWTFALIVPRSDGFARLRPGESYCRVHEAVAAALGTATQLAAAGVAEKPGACFAGQPAQHDVLDAAGAKICGGAQRRTRAGILHQGSLQGTAVAADFGRELAERLSAAPGVFLPPEEVGKKCRTLAAAKYDSRAWTFRLA